jgi:hypothetical protein
MYSTGIKKSINRQNVAKSYYLWNLRLLVFWWKWSILHLSLCILFRLKSCTPWTSFWHSEINSHLFVRSFFLFDDAWNWDWNRQTLFDDVDFWNDKYWSRLCIAQGTSYFNVIRLTMHEIEIDSKIMQRNEHCSFLYRFHKISSNKQRTARPFPICRLSDILDFARNHDWNRHTLFTFWHSFMNIQTY